MSASLGAIRKRLEAASSNAWPNASHVVTLDELDTVLSVAEAAVDWDEKKRGPDTTAAQEAGRVFYEALAGLELA